MANHRQMGAPKRTTRIPARGARLEACDLLLAAAKEEAAIFSVTTENFDRTPKWKWRRRKRLQHTRFIALLRYMKAVTAAQDLANKRVGNRDDRTPDW